MQYQHEIREKKARYTGPRPAYPLPEEELEDRMESYLHARRLEYRLAKANGWYAAYYKSAPRIIIPCSNSEGVPYFQGRAMNDHELRYASPASPRDDSLVIVWPKSTASVGGVVVEGPMDAMAAAGQGFVGVALMGNQPNEVVLDHLCKYARAFQPVLILPDIDALEMGPTVLCAIAQRGIGGTILSPLKKDLAEMSISQRREFLYG